MKVLDCDTISQAKEKMLDQLCKGLPLAQRPDSRTLDVGEGGAGGQVLSPHWAGLGLDLLWGQSWAVEGPPLTWGGARAPGPWRSWMELPPTEGCVPWRKGQAPGPGPSPAFPLQSGGPEWPDISSFLTRM